MLKKFLEKFQTYLPEGKLFQILHYYFKILRIIKSAGHNIISILLFISPFSSFNRKGYFSSSFLQNIEYKISEYLSLHNITYPQLVLFVSVGCFISHRPECCQTVLVLILLHCTYHYLHFLKATQEVEQTYHSMNILTFM